MRLVSSGCRTVFPLAWVMTSCAWGASPTPRDDHAQYPVSQVISYWRDTLLSTPHVASFGSDSQVAATFARVPPLATATVATYLLDIKPSGLMTGLRRAEASARNGTSANLQSFHSLQNAAACGWLCTLIAR
jgi:hypothetical protein